MLILSEVKKFKKHLSSFNECEISALDRALIIKRVMLEVTEVKKRLFLHFWMRSKILLFNQIMLTVSKENNVCRSVKMKCKWKCFNHKWQRELKHGKLLEIPKIQNSNFHNNSYIFKISRKSSFYSFEYLNNKHCYCWILSSSKLFTIFKEFLCFLLFIPQR